MAITNDELNTGKVVFQNLKYLKLIPYTDENGDTLGTKSFTFDTLLGDSVSLQQDDNTINERESETKSEPAVQNILLGDWQFAATSIDTQDKILKEVVGWIEGGGSDNDIVYAPISYKPLWCLAILAFNSTDKVLVVPKLKMNSKAVIASLKTSSGQVDIAGTAYAGKITVNSSQIETTVASVPSEKLTTVIPALAG